MCERIIDRVASHRSPAGDQPATQACAQTGNWTNPLSHTSQGYFVSFYGTLHIFSFIKVSMCLFRLLCHQNILYNMFCSALSHVVLGTQKIEQSNIMDMCPKFELKYDMSVPTLLSSYCDSSLKCMKINFILCKTTFHVSQVCHFNRYLK